MLWIGPFPAKKKKFAYEIPKPRWLPAAILEKKLLQIFVPKRVSGNFQQKKKKMFAYQISETKMAASGHFGGKKNI